MPIYMKFPGIKGDVTAKGHEGWIELTSAMLGTSRNITSPSGRGVNREATPPSISEITVTKVTDGSSPDLFRQSLWGKGVDVQIDFVNTKDDPINPYLSLKLTSALIANFSLSGGGDRPTESLTLNFTSVEHSTGGTKNPKKQAPPQQKLEWHIGDEPTGG